MCVFGKVSMSALGGIGWVLHVCIGYGFVACFMMCIGCMYLVMFP